MPTIKHLRGTGKTLQAAAAVDTPLATVRELIDNAIDAGATSITVSIDADTGGLNIISVTDNGLGISAEDHHLVFASGCTSKLISGGASDSLSLGFRGEALHLISRISASVQTTTRTESDSTAFRWLITPPIGHYSENSKDDGQFSQLPPIKKKRVAAPVGTSIVVNKLFSTLPTRRKALLLSTSSKPNSRYTELLALLRKYAVLHNVHLKLITTTSKGPGDKEAHTQIRLVTPSSSSTSARRISWYFPPGCSLIAGSISEQDCISAEITLAVPAYAGKCNNNNIPRTTSSATSATSALAVGANQIPPIISVNKRLLSTAYGTGKALKKIYNRATLDCKLGVYTWILMIEVPADDVDANIEPKKDDVLLRNHNQICSLFETKLKAMILAVGTNLSNENNSVLIPNLDKQVAIPPSTHLINPNSQEVNSTNTNHDHEELELSYDQSWSRHMHDKLLSSESDDADIGTTTTASMTTDISKSEGISSNDSSVDDVNDQHFTIAKNIEISNPFTMMNMRPNVWNSTNPYILSDRTVAPYPKTTNVIPLKSNVIPSVAVPKIPKQTSHVHNHPLPLESKSKKAFKQSTLPLSKTPKNNLDVLIHSYPNSNYVHEPVRFNELSMNGNVPRSSVNSNCFALDTHLDGDVTTSTVDDVVNWIKRRKVSYGNPGLVEELEGWWMVRY